jgi:Ataxin-3
MTTDNQNSNDKHYVIYHERQEGHLCGQHALNNLVQAPIFSVELLSNIASRLDDLESNILKADSATVNYSLINRSHHIDDSGNFSIEVLKAALVEMHSIALLHLGSEHGKAYLRQNDITTISGFICHKSDHWFAIRKIGSRYWNLNSSQECPTVISHFSLAVEMDLWSKGGYTLFCVLSELPEHTMSEINLESGNGKWYKMSDLLKGSKVPLSATKASDAWHWKNVHGKGMRLDGQQTKPSPARQAQDSLTEEEMIQLAIEASMLESTKPAPNGLQNRSPPALVPLVEPSADDPIAIRIQFRIPNHPTRVVRRFRSMDLLGSIYSFVQMYLIEVGILSIQDRASNIDLLVGFPPRSLNQLNRDQITLAEAKLDNECIQVRLK